jgi:ribonuclease HII
MEGSMKLIAGLDEVGRGALAGPMVVVVAAFEEAPPPLDCITDSKKLTPARREELAPMITKAADYVGFGWSEAWEIDDIGMTAAWYKCCMRALNGAPQFEKLVVDGNDLVKGYSGYQLAVPKADLSVWQVGAASIIAKRMRDVEMEGLAEHYPGYGWESNVGYGTRQHYDALDEYGVTKEHRRLFLRKWAREKGIDIFA